VPRHLAAEVRPAEDDQRNDRGVGRPWLEEIRSSSRDPQFSLPSPWQLPPSCYALLYP
jgi:hypothetical protein